MRTVALGSTETEVSALCLGTMYFGTTTDEETSRTLLDRYVEAGGRFLDTANAYAHWVPEGHGGDSEALLGRWLRDRGNRDELFVATKVGFGYAGAADDPGAERGLTAEQVRTECEKSLKRMGIDTIDLYYAHYDYRQTPLEETLEAFDALVTAGKVRYIGASNYAAWRLADALNVSRQNGWAEFVCVQQKHTYLHRDLWQDYELWPPADQHVLDQCRSKGLGVVAYSPLIRGAYAREDRPLGAEFRTTHKERQLEAVMSLAEEQGATTNQMVLAWMLHSDPQVIPLFSCSKLEQLEENLRALDVELTQEDMARLNTLD